MLGNVYEWCSDYWHYGYYDAPKNGLAWVYGEGVEGYRVFRGGSWMSTAGLVRAAYRSHGVQAYRDDFLGFRCSRVQRE